MSAKKIVIMVENNYYSPFRQWGICSASAVISQRSGRTELHQSGQVHRPEVETVTPELFF